MISDTENYDDIRQQPEACSRRLYVFLAHAAGYLLVSFVLWVVYGLTGDMRVQFLNAINAPSFLYFPWPLIVMGGWGMGLITHGINVTMRSGSGSVTRRQAIEREVQHEMSRYGGDEKPKNDDYVWLTADSEWEGVPQHEISRVEKPKRS